MTDNTSDNLRTDWHNLSDGARITLHPNIENPLHRKPQVATYQSGYFYCDSTDPANGADYYWRDVMVYNLGFTELGQTDD